MSIGNGNIMHIITQYFTLCQEKWEMDYILQGKDILKMAYLGILILEKILFLYDYF